MIVIITLLRSMDGSRDQLGFREWGFYLQAVQFSQTNLQFYTAKHLMDLRQTDQRKTLLQLDVWVRVRVSLGKSFILMVM